MRIRQNAVLIEQPLSIAAKLMKNADGNTESVAVYKYATQIITGLFSVHNEALSRGLI